MIGFSLAIKIFLFVQPTFGSRCFEKRWLNLTGYFLESETMTLIFFDIVWDFYFSGGSIIRYF